MTGAKFFEIGEIPVASLFREGREGLAGLFGLKVQAPYEVLMNSLFCLFEDGEVFVDGFAGGVGEGAGVGVDDGADLDRAEILEGLGGEVVFLVEVGGDDEKAVFIETVEGLVEDFGPDRFVVPVVLVTEEGDVGIADFVEVVESVAAVGDEVGARLKVGFAELFFPAGIGLIDFGGADVESLEVGRVCFFGEELGEDSGFIAATAGEIEEREVLFFGEMWVKEIAKMGLQGGEIVLEEFGKGSVRHGESLI